MTADEFREIALSLPETEERSHMNHPDFRVGGKIFATLGPDESWGMAKLSPEQQQHFLRTEPAVFAPASGKWGEGGATIIELAVSNEDTVRHALSAAWRNIAPKNLISEPYP
jgi:hypothetical protein